MCAKVIMSRTSKVLRWVSLSLLFGGSVSVVVAAITLVKAAEAQGVPVAQAAATNAPVFIEFSKIALAAALALVIGESVDYASHRRLSNVLVLRYAASLLCAATAMVFSLGIVPSMEQLLPALKTNPAAHEEFHKLHETSRMVFGATILLALTSLLLPAFQNEPELVEGRVDSPQLEKAPNRV